MERLRNSSTHPVINKQGQKIDTLELCNTPYAELFPSEDVVIIDWGEDRPTVEELVQPIHYGTDFHGHWAWGSAVKRGHTLGLICDFPRETGLVKLVEDGQRVQRWLLAQGIFGGFTADRLTIGIMPPGSMTNGGHIEDGFGYIKKDIAYKFGTKHRIRLGKAKENWSFWQRIPWDEVKDELMSMLGEQIANASSADKMLFTAPRSFEYKKQLYDADRIMLEHPFVAKALTRSSQEYFARMATTVYLGGDYRVAVPTTCPTICVPFLRGKIEIDRFPIDSYGSIQAIEIEDNEVYKREEQRIANLEAIQVSISSKDFSSKGCLGLADDLPYDIVICSKDIKMFNGDIEKARELDWIEVRDVVVTFNQFWNKGSLVGVNAGWAKNLMGLDHDGDGVRVTDMNHLPKTWQAIRDLPHGETPKLRKSKRLIELHDSRPEMIITSMTNLVGFATNVAAGTFMVKDREWLAKQIGFNSEETMDTALNYFIKVGTDGFKTDVDIPSVSKQVAVIQSNLSRMFGSVAPWTNWNDHEWAFRRGVPASILKDKSKDKKHEVNGVGKVKLQEVQLKNAIWPWMDGTVAEICKITLPTMNAILEEPIRVRPLTEYRKWAMVVQPEEIKRARDFQSWYNSLVTRVNFEDPGEIAGFRATVQAEVENLCRVSDPWTIANALWYVAHSARSHENQAASVFMAFEDFALDIVRTKPGQEIRSVIVTGVHFQVPDFEGGTFRVRIQEVETEKYGKRLIRKVICGPVPGQIVEDKSLPNDLIGFVAMNVDQPEIGSYLATLIPLRKKSWNCYLTNVA